MAAAYKPNSLTLCRIEPFISHVQNLIELRGCTTSLKLELRLVFSKMIEAAVLSFALGETYTLIHRQMYDWFHQSVAIMSVAIMKLILWKEMSHHLDLLIHKLLSNFSLISGVEVCRVTIT